jgi:hypothetical protein
MMPPYLEAGADASGAVVVAVTAGLVAVVVPEAVVVAGADVVTKG